MKKSIAFSALLLSAGACLVVQGKQSASGSFGLFTDHQDIGTTPKAGTTEYDPATREYRVTGSGANIWGKVDALQFVYTKLSGDVTLTADVHFVGEGVEHHRKAVLMIRQSLEPGAPYADVALHGDGLTSLQYRETPGDMTKEIRSDLKAPIRIRIQRRGNQFTMAAGSPAEELKPSGLVTVNVQDPVYVGLGISSHNADVLETAVFSNVTIQRGAEQKPTSIRRSNVSLYDLKSRSIKVIYSADQVIEAPTFSPDGKYVLMNSKGDLWKLTIGSANPVLQKVPLGSITKCNNDKGISPDGKLIAFSSGAAGLGSQVYTVSSEGGTPNMVVSQTPSYFHAFSPDGRWLAVVAQRNNNFDLFRVPVGGGEQQRLTSNPGYDDGPDYSPDGKWIYFNSDRSGKWEVWRMPADGAGSDDKNAQQVTSNQDEEAWFPHCSPDGKWLVFIAFPKGTAGHNAHLNVKLQMIPLPGEEIQQQAPQTLATFFGGQGTINVSSWSPDSTKIGFVSYQQ
jgi:Tol biopolymer transport system component